MEPTEEKKEKKKETRANAICTVVHKKRQHIVMNHLNFLQSSLVYKSAV